MLSSLPCKAPHPPLPASAVARTKSRVWYRLNGAILMRKVWGIANAPKIDRQRAPPTAVGGKSRRAGSARTSHNGGE